MLNATNIIIRTASTAALLGALALAGTSYAAQSGGGTTANPSAPATHAAMKDRRPVDRVEMRIKELHSQLKITAAQEAEWGEVAGVMRENANAMQALVDERAASAKTMTAVDDLHSYQKISDAHEDGLKKFIPAFEKLYDTMSEAQKKNADAIFRNQHGRASHRAAQK
jgi:hypothetical protein